MRVKLLEARVRKLEGYLRRDPKTWPIILAAGELVEDEIKRQAPEYLPSIDRLIIHRIGIDREALDRV